MNKLTRILQKISAILIIFVMTMAQFSIVGKTAISYAIDKIQTNNKNVEILAYFENEKGEKFTSINSTIDSQKVILKVDVTVKNEDGLGGYFNGNISLDNANFRLKKEENTEFKVDAGDTVTIENEIVYQDTEELSSSYLSKESTVKVSGTYVNSNKEYNITGNATVTVNWVAPEDSQTVIQTKMLTNKVYDINGQSKKVVQFLVASWLKDNSYPVKNTKIEAIIPEEATNVTVHKRTTLATNGDDIFNEQNYTYNKDESKVSINIQNNDEKISWNKNSRDILVVTCEYEANKEINNKQVNLNNSITTYDNKEQSSTSTITIDEELDGIATGSIIQKESEIYKGKIYAKETRNYNTITQVNIDYIDAIENLKINESKVAFVTENEEKQANIQYVKTTINKNDFINILGEEGYIKIKDQEGNIVANITKETEANNDNNIEVIYNTDVNSISIETSKPKINKVLNILHEKSINSTEYTREEINELKGIKETIQINGKTSDKVINLKETESNIDLSLNTNTLLASEEKQVLDLKVTLDSSDESKDLYKNPSVKVTFPKPIESMAVRYRLLYANGLELNGSTINKENGKNVLTINLKGEQTKYDGDSIKGAVIEIYAEVTLNKLVTNAKENIVVNYTNENAIKYKDNGEEKAEISIVGINKMILTNSAVKSQVTEFGSQEEKNVQLEVGQEEKTEEIKMQIINNNGNKVKNVSILGKIPYVEGKIVKSSDLSVSKDATIYYSNNENSLKDLNNEENTWTKENISDAKYYLVIINEMENAEKVEVSYNLSIASNLTYNIEAVAGYTVKFTDSVTGYSSEIKATDLKLTTGRSATISGKITARVGEDQINDGDKIKAGEVITYTVNIANSGKEDAKDVNVKVTIPEETTLIEINPNFPEGMEQDEEEEQPYFITSKEKEFTKENVTIGAEKEVTYKYSVRVNTDISEEKDVIFNAIVKNKENKKIADESLNLKIQPSTLVSTIQTSYKNELDEVEAGYVYEYEAEVKNISNVDQENITINVNTNDVVEIVDVSYFVGTPDEIVEMENKTDLSISKLEAGKSVYIKIKGKVKKATDKNKTTGIYIIATDSSNEKYRSNYISEPVKAIEIELNVKQSTDSTNETGYIQQGDKVTYEITVKNTGKVDAEQLQIQDMFSTYLKLESVTLNGKEVTYEELFEEEGRYIQVDTTLNAGENATLVLVGTVEEISTTNTLEVKNKAIAYNEIKMAESNETIYYLASQYNIVDDEEENTDENNTDDNNTDENNTDENNTEDNNTDNDTEDNEENNTDDNKNKVTHEISGTVWLDEDEDGSIDSNEKQLEGITVYAVKVSSNEIANGINGNKATATTDSKGFYALKNLEEGEYLVVFEYDTGKYIVTKYKADNVEESKNSDAIKSSITLDNETKNVAVTDSINLNENKANVNLGLIESKSFNLEIDKYVSKIVVTNSNGTETYDQKDNGKLGKVEIAAKNLKGSNVLIEYKIRVTNKGEVAGYAKDIVDYIPTGLNFSSNLNNDWYQSGKNLYNSSLKDSKIEAGESKEVTLVLTKVMTESNTGLINNKAAIEKIYNTLGTDDNNSDDNSSSADVIIGIKTGATIRYITLVLTISISIFGIIYFIARRKWNKEQ